MIDIVERLRSANGRMGVRDPSDYDVTITVAEANQAATEIEMLRAERMRLAKELAEAHKAILPWIDQVGWLNAEWVRHRDALKKISGVSDVICNTYKEMVERQFAIADEALKDRGHEHER